MQNPENRITELMDRLNALEHRCRRQRWGFVAIGVAILATLLVGTLPTQPPEVIEARKLLIKDADGKTLAMLGEWEAGEIGLFFGEPGKASTSISDAPYGARMKIGNKLKVNTSPSFTSLSVDGPGGEFSFRSSSNDGMLPSSATLQVKGHGPLKMPFGLDFTVYSTGDSSLQLSRKIDERDPGNEIVFGKTDESKKQDLLTRRFELIQKSKAITAGINREGRASFTIQAINPKLQSVFGAVGLSSGNAGTVTQRAENSICVFGEDGKTIWVMPSN